MWRFLVWRFFPIHFSPDSAFRRTTRTTINKNTKRRLLFKMQMQYDRARSCHCSAARWIPGASSEEGEEGGESSEEGNFNAYCMLHIFSARVSEQVNVYILFLGRCDCMRCDRPLVFRRARAHEGRTLLDLRARTRTRMKSNSFPD